ncbi:thioester-containing protein 1 allele S3 isoform X1 [Leptopilina boulardi]|uniref:thioester-containing protein 1 allele S3 isoform X1 n=1 Tax=Leptopilina boulardi TaxID=63433 RepID=UPI0021F5D240|nr:thioester-containing protein 1 allele S3 isoform X1 [Leptopilina boulardi]XP_051162276.1 thioester-containing protein 1 allele S3 isoform X1 [Leptopilina boulardi]XP_051162277.1 thioester-containing protein 1 allele S3 isoform X1 [Leptopilina boulardi]XP_051162278.1 thioester-containing protein 1 allele S3 isoform X1 [Leptopilina boulardi]XP_051162279.1 thioester-containing protein 1 allele S3 isoform X1 [Leptopilina boulardi]
MDWWRSFLFLQFYISGCVLAESYYTVIAPRVVRPNSEYHVAVSTAGISVPSIILVELNARQYDGKEIKIASKSANVAPYSTETVVLQILDIGPADYRLMARGIAGIEFENSTDVRYVHKSYSVLIQTDRAVYKPGNKVMFRCILLNSGMKPANPKQVEIHVMDGKGNRIKQWVRPTLTRGVFGGEIELSESPVLGDWKIVAIVDEQTIEKEFQVAEYVLPNFEVSIDSPAHIAFKDEKIHVTVRAKYTYGKFVKGEATITAYPDIISSVLQPLYQPVRKVVDIDGKASVDFDIYKELRLKDDDYFRPVKIEVAVEEALTGRRQNTSTQIFLHKHRYSMELVQQSGYYKPGLKYTTFIKVSSHDGSPVQDSKTPLQISSTYDNVEFKNFTKLLDQNGMAELEFYPPNNASESLKIEAKYFNLHEQFPYVYPVASSYKAYIQAVLKKPIQKADLSFVEIEVNSTVPMKYLNYQVFGRGNIQTAGTIMGDNRNSLTFRFKSTPLMAPTAHLLVNFISDNGTVIADSIDIDIENSLQNFVDVKMSSEAGPSDEISLTVSTNPDSYIGLLGVDQRSLLLKSGNDISHEQVENEMKSYDKADTYELYHRGGAETSSEVFTNAGAVIITNAYVHYSFPIEKPGILEGRITGSPEGVPTLRPDIGPPITHRLATRPPLAGPFAFSRIPFPVWNRPRVFLMHDIKDTWLFTNSSSGIEGRAVIRKTVPDSITSWVISAFTINDVQGFGLIETPRKLKVFKPFFISMNLPYSVIRGEIVAIPIVVFNYMDKDLIAEVVLENRNQFEFAEISNEVHDSPKFEMHRSKIVKVKGNSGASVSFMVIPKEIGYITIAANATTNIAADGIETKLLVKAEGETQYRNNATFIDLRTSRSVSTTLLVDMPKNIVTGSEFVEISAVGDILGPSIPNLANLIKMPSGCGEQNMLNFVPNIVILDYLTNTNQLKPAIESKALNYLQIGYQQELTYRHNDGSFSAFGEADASGSTWLTAFVAKSFYHAKKYIDIEKQIIFDALQWLADKQDVNGSFPEVGKVSHQDMQGGAAKGLALTAYTLITFLENKETMNRYQNTIYSGVKYITENLDDLDDVYALSLCTYVLNLAKNMYEDTAFYALEKKAMEDKQHGTKWWSKPVPKDDKNPWYSLPRSVDVEMTSYVLLTYLQKNLVTDAIPLMKWLVTQRNSEGGFASTQDTVIGIHALAKLGEKLATKDNNVAITFTYENGGQSQININPANVMILQKHVLPKKTRVVNITASGTGFAFVQVSSRYNLNVTGAWPLFTLDPQITRASNEHHLQLTVCSGFVPTNETSESNMAVMEVSLPSGFTVDMDSLPSLEAFHNVKRVETKNGDTMVVLYFDKMNVTENCPTVSAFRTHKVAKQKPVPVSVYDYYDSTRRARAFYKPTLTTLCDICEEEDCGNVCKSQPHPGSIRSASSAIHIPCTYLALPIFSVFKLFLL